MAMDFDNRTDRGAAPSRENQNNELATGSLPRVDLEIGLARTQDGVQTYQSEPEMLEAEHSLSNQEAVPFTLKFGSVTIQASAPETDDRFTGRDAGSTESYSTPYSFQTAAETVEDREDSAVEAAIQFPGGLVVGASNQMVAERFAA